MEEGTGNSLGDPQGREGVLDKAASVDNSPADLHADAGHRYGNFSNYSFFHPSSDRLDALPRKFFATLLEGAQLARPGDPFLICDIGCNDGELTAGLHTTFGDTLTHLAEGEHIVSLPGSVRTLGVDLDPTLITRARERALLMVEPVAGVQSAARLPQSASVQVPPKLQGLAFDGLDVMCPELSQITFAQFLANSAATLERFHLVSCFSVTMWIHLNHGDAGLESFLRVLATWADCLLIEPQPWKCYRQAAFRLRRQGKPEPVCFQALSARSDKNMEQYIQQVLASAFSCRTICDGAGTWKRKLLLFCRRSQSKRAASPPPKDEMPSFAGARSSVSSSTESCGLESSDPPPVSPQCLQGATPGTAEQAALASSVSTPRTSN